MSEAIANKSRSKWLSPWRLLSLILLVTIFFYVGRQLGRDFKELRRENISVEVNWLYLGASVICLMGARLTNAVNTWLLLRALGARLPMGRVIAVIWMASLGRYIPGKVAVVAGSMAMLMKMGARFSVVGAALTLSTGIMILIGMIGTIPLFFLRGMKERLPSAEIFAVLMVAMAVVCLYPPIFLGICNVGLRMMRREELPAGVRQGPFWAAIGVGTIRIGFVSMSLWFAARSIAIIDVATIPRVVGAASLASVMGFIAVFAPAGLGVHEAVYLVGLKPIVGASVAVLVIMFRGMQVGMDLLVAAIGAMILRNEGEAYLANTSTASAEADPT